MDSSDLIISNVEHVSIYSPSAIVNIIQNVYMLPQEKNLIALRGIYIQKGRVNYNGFWYDELKDESSDSSITLIVPDLVRNELSDKKVIECFCYITKKADKNGNIAIRANLTDLLTQTQSKYSEDDILALEIQQQKTQMGYRDLDSYIKKSIFENRKLKVIILCGKTAIVDEDIKSQMSESISLYDISFVQTKITSVPDIIASLKMYNNDQVDIIAITRGGGDETEIFNKTELAKFCLDIKPYFVTAIAHKVDNPLIEKIADRKFITPTAFGQYLKEIYNNTIDDFEQSKAKLADSITKQLKANYDKQIENLNTKIKDLELLKNNTIKDKENIHKSEIEGIRNLFNQKVKSLTQDLDKYKQDTDILRNHLSSNHSKLSRAIIISVIISLITGLIIGIIIKSF